MSIPAKPTITSPPPAPVRGQDRTTFANRANDYIAWIGTNVTDQTAVIDWQDTVFTATEAEATNAAASATEAQTAADAAGSLATTLGFVGNWSDQTGSADVPTTVYHDGIYWQLLVDVADITATEPGVTSDWASVESKTPWASISTSQTLEGNVSYAVDFTGGPLTLTLPTGVIKNDFVKLYKDDGEITDSIVARNGNTIMGLAEDLTIDFEATSLHLVYNGSDWRIV